MILLSGLAAAQDLAGVVDLHIHVAPDVAPRSVDALEAARQARDAGLRAIVVKNHYEATVSSAYLAAKNVPGIEVFGGIALNLPVGGVNPAAVSRMARVAGGRGRIVWMPTFDAENQVRYSKENRPFAPVSRGGKLLPEVLEVLGLIKKHGLVLATGHSSAAEVLLLVKEARRRGIERILITHASGPPVAMSTAQMKEAAALGAYIEFTYINLIGARPDFTFEQYASAIRAVGPERSILTSDMGQAQNPLPVAGMRAYLEGMRKQGFTADELRRMTVVNPAYLLDLR